MKSWTPDASQHFETWLGRVRTTVSGDPTVNPDDVAQDLRAHVYAELEAAQEPVTIPDVERVLTSLGSPNDWSVLTKEPLHATVLNKERFHVRIERDVMEAVRDLQQRLATTDWGMPVLLGVLSLVGVVTLNDGFGLLPLLVAYFVARSIVTYAPEKVVGRRGWFVYAPLAIGAASMTALVLCFPMMLQIGAYRGPQAPLFSPASIWVLGLWWILVGFVATREVRRVRTALKPFADGFDRSHARMLMLIGTAFSIWATVALFPSF